LAQIEIEKKKKKTRKYTYQYFINSLEKNKNVLKNLMIVLEANFI